MYGPGMRIHLSKFVLISVTSQWPAVDSFRYLVALQGEKEGGLWFKTKDQAGSTEMLT